VLHQIYDELKEIEKNGLLVCSCLLAGYNKDYNKNDKRKDEPCITIIVHIYRQLLLD
jgi:hypothetical protein